MLQVAIPSTIEMVGKNTYKLDLTVGARRAVFLGPAKSQKEYDNSWKGRESYFKVLCRKTDTCGASSASCPDGCETIGPPKQKDPGCNCIKPLDEAAEPKLGAPNEGAALAAPNAGVPPPAPNGGIPLHVEPKGIGVPNGGIPLHVEPKGIGVPNEGAALAAPNCENAGVPPAAPNDGVEPMEGAGLLQRDEKQP